MAPHFGVTDARHNIQSTHHSRWTGESQGLNTPIAGEFREVNDSTHLEMIIGKYKVARLRNTVSTQTHLSGNIEIKQVGDTNIALAMSIYVNINNNKRKRRA